MKSKENLGKCLCSGNGSSYTVLLCPALCKASSRHEIHPLLLLFVAWSCPALFNPLNCSTPGFPVPHHLPKFDCSFKYQISLSSPDTFTTESRFCFGPNASFFLGLLVVLFRSSPAAFWTPSNLRDTSVSVFVLSFYTAHQVLSASIPGGLPFPPPVDHILSELSAMTLPSWVALHGMAHRFVK